MFHYVNVYQINDKNHDDYRLWYREMVMHPNRDRFVEADYPMKEFFHLTVDEDK